MKYCLEGESNESRALRNIPHRFVDLLLATLPLRTETSSADVIYSTVVKLTQSPHAVIGEVDHQHIVAAFEATLQRWEHSSIITSATIGGMKQYIHDRQQRMQI